MAGLSRLRVEKFHIVPPLPLELSLEVSVLGNKFGMPCICFGEIKVKHAPIQMVKSIKRLLEGRIIL